MTAEISDDRIADIPADSDLAGMTRGELVYEIEQLRKQVVRLAEEVVRAEMDSWQTQTQRERMKYIVNESSVYKEMLQAQIKDLRAQLESYARHEEEQVKAEHAIRESLARFERMQRLSHIGSWEWDIRSDTITRSYELLEILGIEERPEVPATDMVASMLVHPEDAPSFEASIRQVMINGGVRSFNYRVRKLNGEIRLVKTSIEAILNDRDETVQIFAIVQEIG